MKDDFYTITKRPLTSILGLLADQPLRKSGKLTLIHSKQKQRIYICKQSAPSYLSLRRFTHRKIFENLECLTSKISA